MTVPPEFRPLTLADRAFIHAALQRSVPETSELTFTNLFIWRTHYGITWARDQDWLLFRLESATGDVAALPPVGPAPRREVTARLLALLRAARSPDPRIERADARFVAELAGDRALAVEPTREHFDYLYRTSDLIGLAGNRYHAKRNFINTFTATNNWRYAPLTADLVPACRALAGRWCEQRRCADDLNLMGEWEAVDQALDNVAALGITGGVILVDDRVEAFALGELLNPETAVVHIEKANPDRRGLYAVINQQFCARAWSGVPFINREQDLGDAGLRQAKLSYHPLRLVEKYRVRLKT